MVVEKREVPKNLYEKTENKIHVAWYVLDDLKHHIKEEVSEKIEMEIIEQHPTEQRLVVQRILL